jgi:hypothetical protein
MAGPLTEIETITVHIPMHFERRGGRKLIIAPAGTAPTSVTPHRDETMIRALVKAYRWRRRIESGKAKSITDLAAQEGVTDAYVCHLLPLTCLAPEIAAAILDGRQQKGFKLAALLRDVPMAWEEQRRGWR